MKRMIRNVIVLLVIASALMFSGCAWNHTTTINGIDLDRMKGANPWKVAAGLAGAVIVHEGLHVLAMEVAGVKDYEFENPVSFHYNTEGISKEAQDNISRIGFIGQAILGTVLTHIPATRESDYVLGYTSGAAAQTVLYPLPPGDGADLQRLSHPWAEYTAYSAWSLFNLYSSIKTPKETPDYVEPYTEEEQ